MKTIKIFLAIMAFVAVNTNAQKRPTESPAEGYSVNTIVITSAKVDLKQNAQTNDAQRSKTISKSFIVDNNDKVNLNNQFGSISIKTWDKKEVRIDIDIKAYSNTQSDVQKLIDAVSIDAAKNGDVVNVKTNMGEKNGHYGSSIKNGVVKWRREVKVSYTVYMPSNNPLFVYQQYGNVDLGNFSGPTSIKVQYGNLTAGNLSNSNNYINVQYGKSTIQELNAAVVKHQYGSGITIGTIGTLDLDAEYVGVNINTIKNSAKIKQEYGRGLTIGTIAGNLLLNAQYVKVNINTIKGNTVINEEYGDLILANVGKLSLSTEYTNVSLGSINGDANIAMKYNRFNVNEITTACKNFNFNAEYVNIGLGFSDRYNANFNVQTSYSGFEFNSNVTSKLISNSDETKKYSGKIGNGGGATVTVKSEYGPVVFK